MITHVAIKYLGALWSLPAPNRHHDVIGLIADTMGIECVHQRRDDEGFLDHTGTFLNRQAARAHALACGQKFRMQPNPFDLYSEDVW